MVYMTNIKLTLIHDDLRILEGLYRRWEFQRR